MKKSNELGIMFNVYRIEKLGEVKNKEESYVLKLYASFKTQFQAINWIKENGLKGVDYIVNEVISLK